MLTFDEAVQQVRREIGMRPVTDAERLKLYGLYKQATKGDVDANWFFTIDPRRREMRFAWESCRGKTAHEARSEYAATVAGLLLAPPDHREGA